MILVLLNFLRGRVKHQQEPEIVLNLNFNALESSVQECIEIQFCDVEHELGTTLWKLTIFFQFDDKRLNP